MLDEEQKEATGIFGGHMLDQMADYGHSKDHVRRSSCGGAIVENTRKTSSSKVATPVFLQKSTDNIRKSEAFPSQQDIQNYDESN